MVFQWHSATVASWGRQISMKFIPLASRNRFQGSAWQSSSYSKCFSHTCSRQTPPNGLQRVAQKGNQGNHFNQKLAFNSALGACVQPEPLGRVAPSGNVGSGFYCRGSGEEGCWPGSGARAVKCEAGSELLRGSGTDQRLWLETVLRFRFNELGREGDWLFSVNSRLVKCFVPHTMYIIVSTEEI